MPSVTRTRTVSASLEEVWELIADPHHMPRWWPGVLRMEGVDDEHFTQVFATKRGRPVRIDFKVVASQAPHERAWSQEIPGTPFERVLAASVVSVALQAAGDGTAVSLTQEQKLRGYSKTGGFLLRRATRDKLEEALDGLQRIFDPARAGSTGP